MNPFSYHCMRSREFSRGQHPLKKFLALTSLLPTWYLHCRYLGISIAVDELLLTPYFNIGTDGSETFTCNIQNYNQ